MCLICTRFANISHYSIPTCAVNVFFIHGHADSVYYKPMLKKGALMKKVVRQTVFNCCHISFFIDVKLIVLTFLGMSVFFKLMVNFRDIYQNKLHLEMLDVMEFNSDRFC